MDRLHIRVDDYTNKFNSYVNELTVLKSETSFVTRIMDDASYIRERLSTVKSSHAYQSSKPSLAFLIASQMFPQCIVKLCGLKTVLITFDNDERELMHELDNEEHTDELMGNIIYNLY